MAVSILIGKLSGALRGSVLFLVLLFVFVYPADGRAFEAKVKYVIDGDTFVMEDGSTVRLASIDTPEIGHDGRKDGYYAREAGEALRNMVNGRTVSVIAASKSGDRYGRMVAWVFAGNIFVNEYMVENGYAYFYYHGNNHKDYRKKILEAQCRAINGQKGFWPVVLKEGKAGQTWIGNRRSHRCFPEKCGIVSKINPANRVSFTNLELAFRQGYSPARNISFWPSVR
ncbi:thermonuclease family protein [Maridesulfovibrio sp.]|uniref:thermonuclease family protein n=1 Tax=Maridesulfovibrio sp. TaxID=2795000 RepID=UPI002A18C49D|nr:thermonuclease family protein [Maridesulfovibrio sp.]